MRGVNGVLSAWAASLGLDPRAALDSDTGADTISADPVGKPPMLHCAWVITTQLRSPPLDKALETVNFKQRITWRTAMLLYHSCPAYAELASLRIRALGQALVCVPSQYCNAKNSYYPNAWLKCKSVTA